MEHTTKNQIFLKKGEIKEMTSYSTITVCSGIVWVTVSGDSKDYVLRKGDRLQISGVKPVIEALNGSYIHVEEPTSKLKLVSAILSWNADVFG